MNRWTIYEWIKQTFMFMGKVPNEGDCLAKFGGLLLRDEIYAGISEFELTTGLNVERMKKRYKRGA